MPNNLAPEDFRTIQVGAKDARVFDLHSSGKAGTGGKAMEISEDCSAGGTVVVVKGRIDSNSAKALGDKLTSCSNRGGRGS
jgi:hypothetical protein